MPNRNHPGPLVGVVSPPAEKNALDASIIKPDPTKLRYRKVGLASAADKP